MYHLARIFETLKFFFYFWRLVLGSFFSQHFCNLESDSTFWPINREKKKSVSLNRLTVRFVNILATFIVKISTRHLIDERVGVMSISVCLDRNISVWSSQKKKKLRMNARVTFCCCFLFFIMERVSQTKSKWSSWISHIKLKPQWNFTVSTIQM